MHRMPRRRFCAALGGALAVAGCSKKEKPPVLTSLRKRVILLGMDGLDPVLLARFMAEGRLPHFSALAARGGFKPFATSNPPQSPVSWASLATGRNPGGHGIFDFFTRDPRTYGIELSFIRPKAGAGGTPQFEAPLAAPAFWDVAAEAGVPTTMLRWPLTFPARGKAAILAGLGTPDLAGRLGSYFLYTTARFGPADEKTRHAVYLDGAGPFATQIPGPLVARSKPGEPLSGRATIPLAIKLGAGAVELSFAATKLTLGEREWSPLVPFSYSLGWFRRCAGMGRFFLARARDPFVLYLSSPEIDPKDPVFPIANPADFAVELAGAVGGRYHTMGMPEDTRAVTDGVLPPEGFLASCDAIMDEQEKMLSWALEKQTEGLLGFVFFTPDRIQHHFWAGLDAEHPFNAIEPKGDAAFVHTAAYHKLGAAPIRACYERLDRIVGSVAARLTDKDILVVLSDHGFTTLRRSLNVNRFLAAEGFMALRDPAGKELFQSVLWDRTSAYSFGFCGIYLNREGREGEGTVAPDKADAVCRDMTAKLLALTDPATGLKPVRRVWRSEELYRGPRASDAPDLVLGLERGYQFSSPTALGACPPDLFSTNDEPWSGTHSIDPDLVPGILLANRPLARDGVRGLDLFPTVLKALGLPVPAASEGEDFLVS